MRAKLRRISYITGIVLLLGAAASAQTPLPQTPLPQTPPDTLKAIGQLHAKIEQFGPKLGGEVWPGYRPDTIPATYIIPRVGKLLISWRGERVEGMAQWPGRSDAWWSDTRVVRYPSGKGIAFNNLQPGTDAIDALGLALHEAFHSYERSAVKPGRRFGGWENAMLTSEYPVFDVGNETRFALESVLLKRALDARTGEDARQLAREFLAVRLDRQRALTAPLVEYETNAEVNEGLAQYALLRGLERMAAHGFIAQAEAQRELQREASLLDNILTVDTRSVRRRFYATGSALGRLLDRVDGDRWKTRLMVDTASIQRVLADAVGYNDGLKAQLLASAEKRTDMSALRTKAARSVAGVKAQRAAQVDSVLNRPGLRVVLEADALPGSRWDSCGFDPQNLLQTGTGKLLHARFLNACSGGEVQAMFETAVIQDQRTGALETVIDAASIRLYEGDREVSLASVGERLGLQRFRMKAAGLEVTAPVATLWRSGNVLRIRPAR